MVPFCYMGSVAKIQCGAFKVQRIQKCDTKEVQKGKMHAATIKRRVIENVEFIMWCSCMDGTASLSRGQARKTAGLALVHRHLGVADKTKSTTTARLQA
jgi:hypothetical protein